MKQQKTKQKESTEGFNVIKEGKEKPILTTYPLPYTVNGSVPQILTDIRPTLLVPSHFNTVRYVYIHIYIYIYTYKYI
jgi:hypothetical protein